MDSNFSSMSIISVFSMLPPACEESAQKNGTRRKSLDSWPGMYHSPVTVAIWSTFKRLLRPPPPDAKPPTRLISKTPLQSCNVVNYNFSTDFVLREQYRDAWNEVRIGKLLEDLDALAGSISVKHCLDDNNTMTRSLLLVTASVDKIVLRKPLSVDIDLKISGSVIWVGRSSMDIQLEVTQSGDVALTANFIFVARDANTGKAAEVNRLLPETEKEKLLHEEAEARSKLRKSKGEDKRGDQSFLSRLEALLAEGRIFCDMPALADRNSILLRDTRLENSLICQPQQRNIHGRIFGGFLMHRAFELAFSTAYTFAGTMPVFLEVDHVDFLRPMIGHVPSNSLQATCTWTFSFDAKKLSTLLFIIPFPFWWIMQVDVGDFLRFKSCVLYTEFEDSERPLITVEVVANVTRPEMRSSEVSNTFYFVFTVRQEAKDTKNRILVRKVVPATEEEARWILQRKDAKALAAANQ